MNVSVMPYPPSDFGNKRKFPFLVLLRFEMTLQVFKNPRNTYSDRDAVFPEQLHDPEGMDFVRKDGGAFEKQRDEQTLRLAEHVAERQQVQNPNRLQDSRPLLVFRNFVPERAEIRADVAVTVNHALWLACRAGRVNDFDNIIWRDFGQVKGMDGRPSRHRVKHGVIDDQSRVGFCSNALDKTRREADINGNSFDTPDDTRPKHRGPLDAIFGPNQHTIAFADIAVVEIADDGANLSVQIVVRSNPRAKSIRGTNSFAAAESLDFGEKFYKSLHGALIRTHYPLYIGAVYSLEVFYEQIF